MHLKKNIETNSIVKPITTPRILQTLPFLSYPKLCFRVVYEPFPEVESAPIRFAVKFYFDMDVPIFYNFFKKMFK